MTLATLGLGLGLATVLTAVPLAHAEEAAPVVPPETTAPVAPATTTTNVTVLPLFGTQLAVSLVSDTTGALTEVNLSNADGYTATMVKPNRVAFESTDGSNTVVVKNRPDGGQRVVARAGTLDGISGPGSWSGDVFGDGGSTTVTFTVSTVDGAPNITVTSVSDPTAQVGEVRREVEGDEASAGVRIRFSNGTMARELGIGAKVETDDDGTPQAKLSVTLGRLRDVSNGEGGRPAEPGKAPEPGEAPESGTSPVSGTAPAAGSSIPEPPKPPEQPRPEPKRGKEARPPAPAVNTPIASTTTEPRRERERPRRGGDTTTTTVVPVTTVPATTVPVTTVPVTTVPVTTQAPVEGGTD